jgi:hypothetical protein
LHILINAYFRGEDATDKIKAWANSVGLHVSFSDLRQTCTFRAMVAQSTPTPPAQ